MKLSITHSKLPLIQTKRKIVMFLIKSTGATVLAELLQTMGYNE